MKRVSGNDAPEVIQLGQIGARSCKRENRPLWQNPHNENWMWQDSLALVRGFETSYTHTHTHVQSGWGSGEVRIVSCRVYRWRRDRGRELGGCMGRLMPLWCMGGCQRKRKMLSGIQARP